MYPDSSISFDVQWNWSKWPSTNQDIEVLCGFYIDSKAKDAAQRLFKIKSSGGYSNENQLLFAATTSVKAPYVQKRVRFDLRIGFENITDEQGNLVHVPSAAQTMVSILKDNYFFKYTGIGSRRPNGLPKLHHSALKRKFPYFVQSILIPDSSIDAPKPLTRVESLDLQAACSIRYLIQNQMQWASPIEFRVTKNVLPPLKIITYEYSCSHYGSTSLSNPSIRQYTIEVSREKDSQTNEGTNRHHIDEHDLTGMVSFSSTPSGTVYLGPSICETNFSQCSLMPSQVHVPSYYKRYAGCYHWMLKKWFVFIIDPEKDTQTLSMIEEESLSDDAYLEQFSWKALLSPRKNFPVDIKCPSLHNVLVWTELGSSNKVHIYKLSIDSSMGTRLGEPMELDHTFLCRCSTILMVTKPVIDIFYPDVRKPTVFEIATICGDHICKSVLNFDDHHLVKSTSIFSYSIPTNIAWFAISQNYVMYTLESNNEALHIREYGNKSSGQIYTITSDLQCSGENGLVGSTFWKVSFPNEEEYLPVPLRKCVFPQISTVLLEMRDHSTGIVNIKVAYDSSPKCASFLKPPVVYTIQYSALNLNFKRQNSSLVYCRDMGAKSDSVSHNALTCRTAITSPIRSRVATFPLGNLIKNMDYYFFVTADIHMYERTRHLWYSGAQLSTMQKILNTKYTPNNLSMFLGIGLPILISTILLIMFFIWYYRRRSYLYQNLARLSASEIHCMEKLGEGNFGEVWRAKLGKNTIVVKRLKESATDKEEKEFREEALLLSKFQSDHIVKPLGICLQSRPIMLGLEYINGGSMDEYLRKGDIRAIITAKDMLFMVKDVVKGCQYLESKGYIHRDVSTRNCLVQIGDQDNKKPQIVKLSDFGLAKDVGNESAYQSRDPSSDILPVAWTPPEAFNGKFSPKSDVWAFGVLMWEVFSFAATPYGRCSLKDTHQCQLLKLTHSEVEFKVCVKKKSLLDLPDPCSAAFCTALKDLFALCWNFNPDERPSFKQLETYLNGAASEILKIAFPNFDLISDEANPAPQKNSIVATQAYTKPPALAEIARMENIHSESMDSTLSTSTWDRSSETHNNEEACNSNSSAPAIVRVSYEQPSLESKNSESKPEIKKTKYKPVIKQKIQPPLELSESVRKSIDCA